jgi:DNA (cytosine-5)-methyltransferase 1
MDMTITSGHLCSGYDGLGRGLSLLRSHETLWHAEADPDMSATLAKHEPGVRNVGDLTTAPWHLAPRPDVITAGIPCQPISGAGLGLGEDDERYLWPYAAEIFRIVRPPFILLENVQRLTSMKLNDGTSMLGKWLADLRDLRYAVTWTVIGACAVGAPHHRHRFYAWCRYVPNGPVPEARKVVTPCGAPRSGGRVLLPTPTASDTNGPGRATKTGGDDLRTAVSLLPTPLARDGNGRGGGSPEYWLARAARRGAKESPPLGAVAAMLPTPVAVSYGNNRGGAAGRVGPVRHSLETVAPNPELWGGYAEAVALWESIIGRTAPEPTEPGANGGRRMSPLLPEWMMGLPEGLLTGHLPRAAAIKGAGNGAVPLQAAAAQRRLATC